MPHFTRQVEITGPLLMAWVGVSQARNAALVKAGRPIPSAIQIQALIDTGASCTCVDPSVLDALQLQPTGPVTMNTPSTGATPHISYQYDVQLVIPGSLPTHIPLILPNIAVASAELLAYQGIHALIGRDILQHCILTYNGSVGVFMLVY